jgi:hypothetical protein
MYIEKLPKENGLEKKILDISENNSHNFIEVSATGDLIADVETYDIWMKAFQEHYNKLMNQDADYTKRDGIRQRGMQIPKENPKICFEVDYSHQCLRFWILQKDKDVRDIVYTFIERLQ